ncbi:hypothetical protein P4O66_021205, partial [Electrophorus voltai]
MSSVDDRDLGAHGQEIGTQADEILQLLTSSNLTTCPLDPIPSAMFQTINQLHDPNQSAYKPAHSTETALIAVTEKPHAAKAAKQSSVLIFLDLSAAFDTVNHNILLSVLSRLGVTGSAWRWFQSYLDGRSYQVSRRISTCLTDIASWMTAHHLKLNPSKTKLLFIPDSSFVTYKGFNPFFRRKLP